MIPERDRDRLRPEQATIPPGHPWNRIPVIAAVCALLGAVACAILGAGNPKQFFFSWLVSFLFFLSLALGALFFVPRLVQESRADGLARHFDTAGAVTVTASLMLLVYGLTQTTSVGWASGRTIGVLIASAVLMAAFLAIETRSRSALMPLGIFRRRTLAGANLIGFGLGTMVFGMFFLLSLYMQQVLGFSALETGVGYLAVALTAVAASGLAQADSGRRGAAHVVANCLVPTALLLLGVRSIAFVAAFAAALADTLGTEIGALFGKRPFSPLTLSALPAGTPGAISLPGTAASLAGAAAIALAGVGLGLVPARLAWAAALGGFLGALAESVLYAMGARFRFRLDHEFANALNTFVGAMLALRFAATDAP